MYKKTIVPFNRICFLFWLYMFLFGNKAFIWFPIICTCLPFYLIFNLFPEFFTRFSSSCANFAIDEHKPISINSNPYPTVVFFEPIYVCISSISITSISSALRNSSNFSPKLFIQLNTATWLTFRKRPMERNPNPSRYSISASRLSFSGFPICSTVKRYLQSLHKYLCLDLTIPSLRKFVLLHFGQLWILI